MAFSARWGAAKVLGRAAACGVPPAALCAVRGTASQDLEREGVPLQRRVADVDELHHLLICAERNLLMSGPSLDLRTIREWHFNHEYHGAIVVREVDADHRGFHQVEEESVEDVLKRRKVKRTSRLRPSQEEAPTGPSGEVSLALGTETQALSIAAAQVADDEQQRASVLAPARSIADSLADKPGQLASTAGQRARDCYDYLTGENEHRRRECYYVYYETSPAGIKYEDVFIRGSTIASDHFGNFFFFKIYDVELGLYIHSGFLSKATQVIDDMQPLLSRNAEISVSGHSLGGAVAAIVGLKLRKRGFNVSGIVTFAAPKFCESLDCPAPVSAEAQGDGRQTLTKRQTLLAGVDFVAVTKPKDPVPHMPPDDIRSLFVGGYVPAAERQLRIQKEHQRDASVGDARPVRMDEVPRHLYTTLYGYYGFWTMDLALFRHGDASEHRLVGYCADMEEALRRAVRERSGSKDLVEAAGSGA